jgi:hypothetical protein
MWVNRLPQTQIIGVFKHNFTSKWQEKEFKAYVPNLPPNTIVSCIDFLENNAFKVQNDI